MSSSHLAQHVTGLLLSLSVFMNCFSSAISYAKPSNTTTRNQALNRTKGSLTLKALGQSYLPAAMLLTNEADLVVYASAQPGMVEPDGTLDLNSTIYNYGPDEATGASLTTTLPPDVTVNSAVSPAGTCTTTPLSGGGTSVVCPLGDMPVWSDQTVTINVTVTADDGMDLDADMVATSTVTDPSAGNNTANPIILVRDSQSGPGGTLVFVSYRDGDAEIYISDADGSGVVNLTNNLAYDWEPAWSPDGTKIVFNSDRSSAEEVWLMDADGSNPTRLTAKATARKV